MKKIWSTYSYTILFLLVSCVTALIISLKTDIHDEEFVKITVTEGDTIWEIAEQYTKDSNLSKEQFVNWVLTQNERDEKQLYPGEELVIPVKNISSSKDTELASAIGE